MLSLNISNQTLRILQSFLVVIACIKMQSIQYNNSFDLLISILFLILILISILITKNTMYKILLILGFVTVIISTIYLHTK